MKLISGLLQTDCQAHCKDQKSKIITFETRNNPPVPPILDIKLNGNAIENITSIRILDVTIHEHLTWKSCMQLLQKKLEQVET